MPFGLCNAPATFERLMERVLAGLYWKICLVYIDDVIVFAQSFDEHLTRLSTVLNTLQKAGLKLKPKKCIFMQTEVLYLGYVVSRQGISTDPNKIQRVKDWPIPCNVKQVRSFVWLCSYYRRFVDGFAQIAAPLHRLTEKKFDFVWNDKCEHAFYQLRSALISAPHTQVSRFQSAVYSRHRCEQ